MRIWHLVSLLIVFAMLHPAFGEETLSTVSYNIRYNNPADGPDAWPNRAEAVADYLDDFDLLGLQEVTQGQLEDLRRRLPDFDYYSVGRNDGQKDGEHASIFFRRSRLEQLRSGTFWLSETPEQAGSQGWDAALPRICSWVLLKDKQTGHQFLFANTHFDHLGSQAREQSGELLRQRASDLPAELPVILTGDFNCLPGSNPYLAIIEDSSSDAGSLQDARSASQSPPAGPQSTWCGFSQLAEGRIIDHIFVRGPLTVRSLQVDDPRTDEDRFASDHLPVRAVIQIGEAESAGTDSSKSSGRRGQPKP